jgi:peptide/nickel transport system permease protein
VPTVLLIVVVNFFVLRAAPGDVVDVLAGEAGVATAEYVDNLRHLYGLDQPALVQLGRYVGRLLSFDLGYSFRFNTSVFELIAQRLPATLLLMGVSITIAIVLGVVLGATAARNAGRPLDGTISVFALLAYATPTFWIGLMLIVLFGVKLRWLPTSGMVSIGAGLTGAAWMLDVARHLVLPGLSLALFFVAIYTRMTRASMLEIHELDYIRTAHAKGLSDNRVTYVHVLRNAVLPVVTVAGMQIGALLGGSVLIETVFAWPGLGRLAFEAVIQRDANLLLGILFMSSLLVIAVNIVVDLLYAALDPRIQMG